MKLLPKLMLLALPVLVAACGGGGDKTCTGGAELNKTCVSTSHALPEGIWYGATTTGLAAQTIVLENGQYFTVYTSGNSLNWMTQGTFTATAGNLTDGAGVALTSTGTIFASTITGTFADKNTLAATTYISTTPAQTILNFNGAYNAIYDTPLAVSDVVGTWTTPSATTSGITFQSDGTAAGTQGACTFTGSFKARATGKHLLDGTLNFTSVSCAAGNGVSMPVEATVVNGQLTIVGVTPQRSHEFYMAAVR
jgi:hypothetical protein